MKKFVSIILSALMLFALPALAQTADGTQSATVSGFVLSIDENGSLTILQSSGEEIIAHVNADTVLGFEEAVEPGRFVVVDYNGASTRSLPPQINAQRVYGESLAGIVVEVLSEDRAVLLCAGEKGHVLVRIPEEMDMPTLCEQITVHYNGVMTMSLPGQINALAVETIAPDKAR